MLSAYKYMNYLNGATLNLYQKLREKWQVPIKNTYLHNTMAYKDSPTWISQASQYLKQSQPSLRWWLFADEI